MKARGGRNSKLQDAGSIPDGEIEYVGCHDSPGQTAKIESLQLSACLSSTYHDQLGVRNLLGSDGLWPGARPPPIQIPTAS